MNHDVPSRRNLRPIASQNFSDAAADAIAYHCTAQSFLDADAKPADRRRRGRIVRWTLDVGEASRRPSPRRFLPNRQLRAEEYCKLRARAALARAIDSFVISAPQQSHGARKTQLRAIPVFRSA